MPKSIDNEIVTSLLTDIRASGEKDKAALRKESKALQEKLVDATETILDLSIAKKGLEKDVRFFRDTKWSRDIGAAVLAICGISAHFFIAKLNLPAFSFDWFLGIGYYCVVVAAAVSVFWGVCFSRIKPD